MNHDNMISSMKILARLARNKQRRDGYMRKKTMKIVAESIKKKTEEEVFKSRLEGEADMVKRHMAGGWGYGKH